MDLLVLATGTISIPDLYRLAVSMATSMEQVRSSEWRAQSFCFACLTAADKRAKSAGQKRDFELVADYMLIE